MLVFPGSEVPATSSLNRCLGANGFCFFLKCISKNYVNNSLPLLWECKKNHQFRLSLSDVKNKGDWCQECIKLGIEFAQNLSNKRGGTCLSSSYHSRCIPLSWRCSEGHSWLAWIDSIQRETWCPHCVGKSEKLDIEYTNELAHSRNGNVYLMFISNHMNASLLLVVLKTKTIDSYIIARVSYSGDAIKTINEIMLKYPSKIHRPDFLKTLDYPTGLELEIYYLQYGFAPKYKENNTNDI
ncbi:1219_t:CDS:2 [Gigaspora margarita]|uniref:1219_t:CDS:1 n=1 Tax=Gigaspora margarita TaxID=4874 RepID=A0ABN7USD4_GIGMA|nr:1219_t:CDS:2 [Gigaspora margarita]